MKMTENYGFESEADKTPNLDRLKLWADELINNTERVQGQGHLRDGDKYCCLGVAVEVAMANGCEVIALGGDNGLWRYDGCLDFLPSSVANWYGVSHNPAVGISDACREAGCGCRNQVSATGANDDKNWTFRQIGEGIRQFYGLGG
jgi:hypothetical protein